MNLKKALTGLFLYRFGGTEVGLIVLIRQSVSPLGQFYQQGHQKKVAPSCKIDKG